MKKIYVLSLVLLPLLSFAQSFVLRPGGLRNADNTKINYLVIDIPDKTAEELYNASWNYIQDFSLNPQNAILENISGKSLTFHVYISKLTSVSRMIQKSVDYEGLFDVKMQFKDGRVRYEILNFEIPEKNSISRQLVLISDNPSDETLFYRTGSVKLQKQKKEIEDFFVLLIDDYIASVNNDNGVMIMTTENDPEDW